MTTAILKDNIRIPASPTQIFAQRNQLNNRTNESIDDSALKIFETYSWGGCACRNS